MPAAISMHIVKKWGFPHLLSSQKVHRLHGIYIPDEIFVSRIILPMTHFLSWNTLRILRQSLWLSAIQLQKCFSLLFDQIRIHCADGLFFRHISPDNTGSRPLQPHQPSFDPARNRLIDIFFSFIAASFPITDTSYIRNIAQHASNMVQPAFRGETILSFPPRVSVFQRFHQAPGADQSLLLPFQMGLSTLIPFSMSASTASSSSGGYLLRSPHNDPCLWSL